MVSAQVQQEIDTMISTGDYTPKQIAIRRGTSVQAVYAIIKKLHMKQGFKGGFKKTTPTIQPPHPIRLHGVHLKIGILWQSDSYKPKINKIIQDQERTISLWKDCIEIHIHQDFIGLTPNEAIGELFLYLNHLLPIVENDLKIVILKPRATNIKIVSSHYSEGNNELSKRSQEIGEYIRCYTKDDGKLWFLFDFSKKNFEAEAVHPGTAKEDMTKLVDFFNDIRDKEHYKPSEIKGFIDIVLETEKNYATLIQRHLIVQEETLKTLKAIRKQANQTNLKRWF